MHLQAVLRGKSVTYEQTVTLLLKMYMYFGGATQLLPHLFNHLSHFTHSHGVLWLPLCRSIKKVGILKILFPSRGNTEIRINNSRLDVYIALGWSCNLNILELWKRAFKVLSRAKWAKTTNVKRETFAGFFNYSCRQVKN